MRHYLVLTAAALSLLCTLSASPVGNRDSVTEDATTPAPYDRIRRLPSAPRSSGAEEERRDFPEMDERGFDEDVFDEGFGQWDPMRKFR